MWEAAVAFQSIERAFVLVLALGVALGAAAGRGLSRPENADPKVPPEICAWVHRLHRAALAHIAADPESATRLARSFGYAQYAHPWSMCGPLTASILYRAGVLQDPAMIPAFWLLDPDSRTDQRLLERAFPPERYRRYDFLDLPISMFDFQAFPLVPGDVLYLYGGLKWRAFEHVMVVTYVDRAGRAYSVSNVGTPVGFVVQQILLYDPHAPGRGYFYWWNDHGKKEMLGGLTGTGGFTVWRPRFLLPYVEALARGACAWKFSGLWLSEDGLAAEE